MFPKIDHHDLMLATSGKALFKSPGWIYELKHDGFRCLSLKAGEQVRMLSRNGRDMRPQVPEMVEALRLIRRDFVIDGEVVSVDERGHTDWDRVRTRSSARSRKRLRKVL